MPLNVGVAVDCVSKWWFKSPRMKKFGRNVKSWKSIRKDEVIQGGIRDIGSNP